MAVDAAPLSFDRAGPRGGIAVVLLHAGIADRRMWQPQWAQLTGHHDVVRVDLRGFGDSDSRPQSGWSHAADLIATLRSLDIRRAHLIGCSLGAGLAAEVGVAQPELVASMLLVSPGGALITEATDDLRAFAQAENAALAADDLDSAATANVSWWVVGTHRVPGTVPQGVRDLVWRMQRRAFELTIGWDDIEEAEPEAPLGDQLGEVVAPTQVLLGALDLRCVALAAEAVHAALPQSTFSIWDDVAHLPSLERPDDFCRLVEEWLVSVA